MCLNMLHSDILYDSASNRHTFIDSFLPAVGIYQKNKNDLNSHLKQALTFVEADGFLMQAESHTEGFQTNFLHYSHPALSSHVS